jgi:hypothetical protein
MDTLDDASCAPRESAGRVLRRSSQQQGVRPSISRVASSSSDSGSESWFWLTSFVARQAVKAAIERRAFARRRRAMPRFTEMRACALPFRAGQEGKPLDGIEHWGQAALGVQTQTAAYNFDRALLGLGPDVKSKPTRRGPASNVRTWGCQPILEVRVVVVQTP